MLDRILKARKTNSYLQSNAVSMEQDAALEIKNVSKKFSRTLKSSLKYGLKDIARNAVGISVNSNGLRPEEFWALKDVSLRLKTGESLGLLGLNGSGKSTLLKIINGIYLPDDGEVRLRGRVGALIEIGAGFHPMLTGRENIYTKGALLGLSKEEIDEIYEEIVGFADIGEFIDSPVRTYSSGMYMRLGFAVAASIDPDILLVDEVLAVGDFKFRQKCLDKINNLREKMAVVFVSHSMRDISRFCDRAIVLEKGKVSYEGGPDDAIAFYLEEVESKEKDNKKTEKKGTEKDLVKTFCGDLFHNKNKITDVKHRWVDEAGNTLESVKHGGKAILEFSFKLLYRPGNLVIGVPIWDKSGNLLTALNTDISDVKVTMSEDGYVNGRLFIEPLIFNSGQYVSVLSIVDGVEFIYRSLINEFRVKEMPKYFGFITIDSKWELE